MKKFLSLLLLAAFFTACENDNSLSNAAKDGLQLLAEANPEWQYENLRLYPIVADEATIEANASLKNLKTLAEGMKTPGFRVLERKQFGRGDEVWYHGLTVQNKSQDTILLLSGDVVTGGNQDRVIAHHEVIPPMTVKNVEVFCVEAGRSHYYDPTASAAEKELAAFKGYYNVASPQVRRAVQTTGNQSEVWAAVAKVTSANDASSSTSAYAALETENATKAKRDAYLRYFDGKLTAQTNVIGMVAVCGDRVLGVDMFGHPDLFRREYSALLHGYVAEAATADCSAKASDEQVQQAFGNVTRLASAKSKSNDEAGKFERNGVWVHLFSK